MKYSHKWFWFSYTETPKQHKNLHRTKHQSTEEDHLNLMCYTEIECRDCGMIFRDYYHGHNDDEGQGMGQMNSKCFKKMFEE